MDDNQVLIANSTLDISPDHQAKEQRDTQAVTNSLTSITDNVTIIRNFISGNNQLVSNQSIRIETALNSVQLISKKGEVLAFIKSSENQQFCLIKYDSPYREVLNLILLENNFLPVGKSEQQQGFFEYKRSDVPAGYKLNWTEAQTLWKIWWPSQKRKYAAGIQLDILIYQKNQWYPIQDIVGTEGFFKIKTLIGEITLGLQDKVAWINKINQQKVTTQNQNVLPASNQIVGQQKPGQTDLDLEIEKILNELKIEALKALANYLANGEVENTTEIMRNAKGEITGTKTITVQKDCPQWVIEQILNQKEV
ncbi:MAG TPA: hypothetical protein V6D15_23270 [Oculatellaceae cyanobacterium]|jgi:hypothetical protein